MFGIWLSKELPLCSRTGKVFSKNITFLALTRSKKHGEQTNKTNQHACRYNLSSTYKCNFLGADNKQ